MATKPYRKNAWSFRSSVLTNPATMAFNPGSDAQPADHQSKRRRSPHKPRRHIFQRLEDSRDAHALDRHTKTCQDYQQTKEKVKIQCGKRDEDLLMESIHLYRPRLENAELLDQARGVEDCHSGEQVWAMSLREHWTVEPRIGDLYSTPICYVKKGYLKDIEQIGFPDKANLNDLLSAVKNSKKVPRLSTLKTYKHFIESCEKKLAKIMLHKPEFPGFQVVGTRLSSSCAMQSEEVCEPTDFDKVEDLKLEANNCEVCGPKAELSNGVLFLKGRAGELVSSSVTLKNTGSTCLYYNWVRQPAETLTEASKKGPKTENFHIFPEFGSIVPGETIQFFVGFRSGYTGTFIESWRLCSAPQFSTGMEQLILRGMAVSEDINRISRKLLEDDLDKRQCARGVDEVIDRILTDATSRAGDSFGKQPQFILSDDNFTFLTINESFSPPVYFSPTNYDQFKELTTELPALLDITASEGEAKGENASPSVLIPNLVPSREYSACYLLGWVDKVTDKREKEKVMQIAASLVELAGIPPHPSSLLHTAMHKALGSILNGIVDLLEETKYGFIETTIQEVDVADGNNKMEEDMTQIIGQDMGKISTQERTFISTENPSIKSNGVVENQQELKDAVNGVVENQQELRDADEARHAVKVLLQKGVENFFSEVESAVVNLARVIQRKMETLAAHGDIESEAWFALWLQRLTNALYH